MNFNYIDVIIILRDKLQEKIEYKFIGISCHTNKFQWLLSEARLLVIFHSTDCQISDCYKKKASIIIHYISYL